MVITQKSTYPAIATVLIMNFLFAGGIATLLNYESFIDFIVAFMVFNFASFGVIAIYERKDLRDYLFKLFCYYADKDFRKEVKEKRREKRKRRKLPFF